MSDRGLIRLARLLAVIGLVGALAQMAVALGEQGLDGLWSKLTFIAIFTAFFSIVVWVVAPAQPRNMAVWTLAATVFFGGITGAGFAVAAQLVSDPSFILRGDINNVVPATLPPLAAVTLMVTGPALVLAIYPPFTLGLLLFPDGRLPSRRWRWVAVLSIVGFTSFALGFGWLLRPSNQVEADQSLLASDIPFLICLVAVALCLTALLLRFRRSRGEQRQQFKWVVWGASILVPTLIVVSNLEGTRFDPWSTAALLIGVFIYCASYGIAIRRYRLYDVDLVITRTVTYGVLAGFLAAAFALIVVALGSVLGGTESANRWVSLLAIGILAVAFEPARVRVEAWVNRLVFGRRASPLEVLSRLTAELSASHDSDETIGHIAHLIADGTGADETVVWLRVGSRLRPEAAVPDGAGTHIFDVALGELPRSPVTLSVEVTHGEELLGGLTITKPRNEPPSEADERLLQDVAAGAGLFLRNLRLNAELAERAEEVRSSRRRLILAHDSARHRLERDLHDGAQQQVVALKVKLGLAKAIAEREGVPDVASTVSALADETQEAVDQMRVVAHGIYPPLLEAEGLMSALRAASRSVPLTVTLEAPDLGRLPRQIEETAYFYVTELMADATRAGATRAEMQMVVDEAGELSIVFAFDATTGGGRSPTLIDRVEAADGTVVELTNRGGTELRAHIPVPVEA